MTKESDRRRRRRERLRKGAGVSGAGDGGGRDPIARRRATTVPGRAHDRGEVAGGGDDRRELVADEPDGSRPDDPDEGERSQHRCRCVSASNRSRTSRARRWCRSRGHRSGDARRTADPCSVRRQETFGIVHAGCRRGRPGSVGQGGARRGHGARADEQRGGTRVGERSPSRLGARGRAVDPCRDRARRRGCLGDGSDLATETERQLRRGGGESVEADGACGIVGRAGAARADLARSRRKCRWGNGGGTVSFVAAAGRDLRMDDVCTRRRVSKARTVAREPLRGDTLALFNIIRIMRIRTRGAGRSPFETAGSPNRHVTRDRSPRDRAGSRDPTTARPHSRRAAPPRPARSTSWCARRA